jgi:putative salt-induced outer membrane protein YdiY
MTTLLAVAFTSLASAQPVDSPLAGAFATQPAPGFVLTLPPDEPPPDLGKWKGSISVGATASDGNTNRKTGTATADVSKRREKDRISFGFLWNYAKEEGVTTQRRTLGTAKYDYFLTKKAYLLAQASGESDLNAQLDLRTIVGVGAGYQFREDEKWKIAGEAGLAYVDENYEDNTADKDFLAARLAYKVDWKASDLWEAGQAAEIFPSLENKEDVNARVDTHAKLTLTKSMFAQFQWLFTWDNTPATGAKRVDDLYLVTLGWSF